MNFSVFFSQEVSLLTEFPLKSPEIFIEFYWDISL